MSLTHHDLPDAEIVTHTAGWRHYVVRLGAAAEGEELEPDRGPS